MLSNPENGIIELYLTIDNWRKSHHSDIANLLLLEGFKKKVFGYHLDFDDNAEDWAGWLNKNVHLRNIKVHKGPRRIGAAIVGIRTFFSMLKTMRRERVNIIRAQDPHFLGINAWILSRLTDTPFIVQICSNYEVKDRRAKGLAFKPFMFQWVERRVERAIMRAADMVLTDREHYRKVGLIPKDIERYGNMGFFVSDNHYDIRERKYDT